MTVIDQRPIRDVGDLLELNIISLRHTGGAIGQYRALRAIDSWFNSKDHGVDIVATATTVNLDDYTKAPIRNDFPDWEHKGGMFQSLVNTGTGLIGKILIQNLCLTTHLIFGEYSMMGIVFGETLV